MNRPPDWPLGLACMAHTLSRDLQRASRMAGGPEQLWRGSAADLARWLRVPPAVAERAITSRDQFRATEVREALARAGVAHVALASAAYPDRLARIFDPPFGVFGMGQVVPALARAAEGPTIAIVGSRRPSGAGRRFAHDLAAALVQRGAVVVSGLARGIDTAAHEGALAGCGVTIGVLGSSVDQMHPRRNEALAQRMMATGAVISEYWPGTAPAPWRFPARNRIVAGLADAVVVVEAAARSGALITADFAMEHGAPVLAVPGWPGAEMSAGCNALIRAGAALCECVDDVVHEVPNAAWAAPAMAVDVARDPAADAVLRVVGREAMGVDEVAAALRRDPQSVAAALAALEIEGVVARDPGGRFRAVASARGR